MIVLMVKSPRSFKEYESKRYIHRFTKAVADSGIEFRLLSQMIFVQLDKALEQYLDDSYNDDEDVELLKLFAMIADINNEKLADDIVGETFLEDIKKEVFTFTRDKEVQNMLTAEDMAVMDYNTDICMARKEGRIEGERKGRIEGERKGRIEGRIEGMKDNLHQLAQYFMTNNPELTEEDAGKLAESILK